MLSSTGPMLRRSLLQRVALSGLAGLGMVLGSRAANAQSIGWPQGVAYPIHLNADGSSRPLRDVSLNPQWVSYQDCEDGEILQFPLLLQNWTGADLFEIWAGTTDCTNPQARGQGQTYQCWQVYSNSGPNIITVNETLQINIAVRDILAYLGGGAVPQDGHYHPNQGNEGACHTQVNDSAVTPAIYFMAINQTAGYSADGSPFQYSLTTDLVGPPPPGNPTIALGDTLLVVNWSPIVDPSTVGYKIFMDPIPGQEALGVSEAGVLEASTATETYCPDSSTPPVDAATPVDSGDDGASDAEAGVSGGPVDSGCFTYTINQGSSATPVSSCSSGVLSTPPSTPSTATQPVLGDGGETFFDAGDDGGGTSGSGNTAGGGNSNIPLNYLVASAPGQTNTNASIAGLVDGVTYNVVVSAYDGTGNIGPQ